MKNVQLTKESFTNYSYFEAVNSDKNEASLMASYQRNFVTYLTLFSSDLYCINDLNCYHNAMHIFTPNYTGQFSINLTRRGYFTFETYRSKEEEYAGRIMLEKPGCEFNFIQQEPGDGSCTVISFTDEGYRALADLYPLATIPFFSNRNTFSTVITGNACIDLFHHLILQDILRSNTSRLKIDCLVAELTEAVMTILHGVKPVKELPNSLKRYHLRTLERAREYLVVHFMEDITLQELASYCYLSHFHFTRLFKQLCGHSPFHYLQQMRLKYAEMLIRTTDLPVADICFQSGFNRPDYFSGSFRKQYGCSPVKYRLKKLSKPSGMNPLSWFTFFKTEP